MKVLSYSFGGPAPQRYADWDDAALAAGLREDDERAFAEIYRRYWAELFQLARYKLGSETMAEEAVQDLFAALWSKRRTQEPHKLGPYLHTALRYHVIDIVRARATRADYLAYCQLHTLPIDHATEETLAANDLSAALIQNLGTLPVSAREVFQLSRFEHRTVAEIAAQLKISPKMVEYHLTKALKSLRFSLREFIAGAVLLLWLQG